MLSVVIWVRQPSTLYKVVSMSEQNQESQVPAPLPKTASKPRAPKTGRRAGSRARQFPLFLHQNGQWCKKIRGKLHYFGTDKQEALERYYREFSALHSGQGQPAAKPDTLTVGDLCNLYLDHQLTRAKAGQIRYRQYKEPQGRLKAFGKFIGPDRLVSDIRTLDLQRYQSDRINAGKAPTTVNNDLAPVKAMFTWAVKVELLEKGPNLDAIERVPVKEVDRQTFTPDEIAQLLAHANVQMRAMILLGLNCDFGCTDCAELQWKHLDLEAGRVDFPRPKTGVPRNLKLWPRTVEALKAVPVRGEFVFYTKAGNTWGWRESGRFDEKPLTRAFNKLMKKAGIVAAKGTGFYTLRRTGATVGAETGDVFAVQGVLGHKDLAMASKYVQKRRLTAQTDRAIEHTERWLDQSIKTQCASESAPSHVTGATEVSQDAEPATERAQLQDATSRTHPPTATGCATTP